MLLGRRVAAAAKHAAMFPGRRMRRHLGGGGSLPLDDGCGQWSVRDLARPFDVGGDNLASPFVLKTEATPIARWEVETHALFLSLVKGGLMRVDELRAGIERLDARRYLTWGYYDKWSSSMATALLERGFIGEDELNAALGTVSTGSEPIYDVGAVVRVKPDSEPLAKHRKPHVRVPAYVHGAVGVVEAYRGTFEDPEFLAFRGTAEKVPLYTVRFTSAALGWGSASGDQEQNTVCAEVYQSWLEAADARDLADANTATAGGGKTHHHHSHDDDDDHRDHDHDHHHHDHDSDHEHLSRYDTEKKAVAAQGPETPGERLTSALLSTLRRKGHVEVSAFREAVEAVERMASPLTAESLGPRLVARAWKDPDFKARLLSDAARALEDDFGFRATHSTAPVKLVAYANGPAVHNLAVCTLCSCYPLTILGLSPSWYKDVKYRARAVRDPRGLLKDAFGLEIPPQVSINVLDSTADCRYIVIPEPPPNVHDLDEEQLATLVSRDSMIGVAQVSQKDPGPPS